MDDHPRFVPTLVTIEHALPILQDVADLVLCSTDLKTPKAVKIGVIMLSVVSTLAAVEVCQWLSSLGIAPETLYKVLQSTGSWASGSYVHRVLIGGLRAGGNIRNTHKDLAMAMAMALAMAEAFVISLPVTAIAEQMMQIGREGGLEG